MSAKQTYTDMLQDATFLSVPEMKILARHLTELALVPDDGNNPPLEMLVASTRLEAKGELRVLGVRNGLSVLGRVERDQWQPPESSIRTARSQRRWGQR